ncbi:uncharacterized protein MYCFIDRAFT_173249 [Pseudocercospora fijiensis CIRAD86]|uniref:Uncharacterized protein n=1 Tax=Pseudocercospora fijiensis (strain CIRAD86) TaxID=383855 RepID=M2Z303_PSEFD|nr:uncharacterized protein MYCFIDRAFT_173249 [Pseudocercospora fijiensis CIRAD86]EME84220.1 hypothetical protein MYCFIDRAFT_173249 [Pseudocercospora fijiensis CIRAD86]
MGVVTTRIFVSTPYQKKGIQFFMHLSATPDMPKMTPLPFVGLPATEDTNAAEVDHYGSLGTTTTDVLPDTDHPHLQVSTTYYEPSTKLHPYFKGKDVERPDPCQAGQLTVLDVDAAKENWDAALLKEYTNKLGLHVIPTAGKDAHQPHHRWPIPEQVMTRLGCPITTQSSYTLEGGPESPRLASGLPGDSPLIQNGVVIHQGALFTHDATEALLFPPDLQAAVRNLDLGSEKPQLSVAAMTFVIEDSLSRRWEQIQLYPLSTMVQLVSFEAIENHTTSKIS